MLPFKYKTMNRKMTKVFDMSRSIGEIDCCRRLILKIRIFSVGSIKIYLILIFHSCELELILETGHKLLIWSRLMSPDVLLMKKSNILLFSKSLKIEVGFEIKFGLTFIASVRTIELSFVPIRIYLLGFPFLFVFSVVFIELYVKASFRFDNWSMANRIVETRQTLL